MKAVIDAAQKRSFGDSLVSQYALYVITECLKNDVGCDIEEDDGDCLTEMKKALNAFLRRQSRSRFAYEQFIKRETGKSVDEAREYVAMVLEVLEQHEDGDCSDEAIEDAE
jgi:hypothetical protein